MGRPRAAGPSTSGLSTEEDILVAAAELFCTVGYGSASTYAIARSAGISQASMYHYFDGKHAILLELLMRTVHPSVEYATALLAREDGAEARLWALCAYDVGLLVSGEQNTGALYLLPELSDERFAPFHAERNRLYEVYRHLVAACNGVAAPDADRLASVVFGLVESVILRRRTEPALAAGGIAETIADASLRLVGCSATQIKRARASLVI